MCSALLGIGVIGAGEEKLRIINMRYNLTHKGKKGVSSLDDYC